MYKLKLACLLACALTALSVVIGSLIMILYIGISAYTSYNDITNEALEQNITTKQFHICNITETNTETKYLDTTEGIRIIVNKNDDIFWTYKLGDEISVTYGRADKDDKSIYNYKITSLLSSENEYKPVEQTKTLKWKHFQEKIKE